MISIFDYKKRFTTDLCVLHLWTQITFLKFLKPLLNVHTVEPSCMQPIAWTEENDGWVAEQLEIDCDNEPDIESDEWDLWMHNHSDMPYVYQLPVNIMVENYINKNFRFKINLPYA